MKVALKSIKKISQCTKQVHVGIRGGGRSDMRLSRVITDYRLSQNEAFSLVKCIRLKAHLFHKSFPP